MVYYIANFDATKNKICSFEETTEEQINIFYDEIDFINTYSQVNRVLDMVIGNSIIVKKYYNSNSQNAKMSGVESENILKNINKYLFDYLTSFHTFIDVVIKAMIKIDSGKEEDIKKEDSRLYDEYFEYRFFKRLRNYIVHYDFPLTKLDASDVGIKISASKKSLLRFKSWSTVKDEIQKLDEEIDILSMIDSVNNCITLLYYEFLYLLAPVIDKAASAVMLFNNKYKYDQPVVIIAENKNEFLNGKLEMKPISNSLNNVTKALKELLSHPSVKVKNE